MEKVGIKSSLQMHFCTSPNDTFYLSICVLKYFVYIKYVDLRFISKKCFRFDAILLPYVNAQCRACIRGC